jgi:hypothetical protein
MTGQSFGRRVKRIDELAQSVPPSRDLWPAIAAAIEADKLASLPATHRRRSAWLPAAGMAAAVALVAIGVLIGRSTTPQSVTPPVAHADQRLAGDDARCLSAARRAVRRGAGEAVGHAGNRAQEGDGEPRTLRRSIDEIEAALGHDPANALLQELFVSSCQEEMRGAMTAVRDSGSQET